MFDLFLLFIFVKAFLILFATIIGSFCGEPTNVEVSTPLPANAEDQPQKRAIFSDCDGPIVDGLHSDVAVHSDLAIGLHGHSYAPSYSSGYLASGGYGALGHVGSLGAAVVAPSPLVSTGYAAHAPVYASSVVSTPVVSHAPVIAAPAVCQTRIIYLRKFKYSLESGWIFEIMIFFINRVLP